MGKDIICADCGAERRNVSYANTLYCASCRLLRDLALLKDQTRTCSAKGCRKRFAPVNRRDAFCGPCGYGSSDEGFCWYCKRSDAELHRAGMAVCTHCIRDPTHRRTILAALRKGQKERRTANAHVPKES